MLHHFKGAFFLLCLNVFSSVSLYAQPWFTGPILAPAGHTIPRGMTNIEIYGFNANTYGRFDKNGHALSKPLFHSWILTPIITHGFTDWADIQLTVPYSFNNTRQRNYNRLNDISLALGIQALDQKKSSGLPDLRVTVQEIFPTGKFENLNPELYGTDSTGFGSYRTQLALNFQYLAKIYNEHYLRTRLILSHVLSSLSHVRGVNSFGGTINTKGVMHVGTENHIDLAFEYNLTQNWVAVMEGYYAEGQGSSFDGILNFATNNILKKMQMSEHFYEYGLAPALEYNITSNVGFIGGVWFPVTGKNSSRFTTYVLALNAYW